MWKGTIKVPTNGSRRTYPTPYTVAATSEALMTIFSDRVVEGMNPPKMIAVA